MSAQDRRGSADDHGVMLFWATAVTATGLTALFWTERRAIRRRNTVNVATGARSARHQRRTRFHGLVIWGVIASVGSTLGGMARGDLALGLATPGLAIWAAVIATGGRPRRLIGPGPTEATLTAPESRTPEQSSEVRAANRSVALYIALVCIGVFGGSVIAEDGPWRVDLAAMFGR